MGEPAMTPTVGVVLVNHNGLADTRDCLRSLAAVDYPRFFPVVVDNASFEDPTPALAADFPGCDVVRNADDLGWTGGSNAGIRHCLSRHADFVILLSGRRYDPHSGYAGAEAAVFPALSNTETLAAFAGEFSTAAPKAPEGEAAEIAWLLGTPFLVQVIEGVREGEEVDCSRLRAGAKAEGGKT